MMGDLQTIQDKIVEISDALDGAYFIPVDQENIKNIRAAIIELLQDAVGYLSKAYSEMTPWQKEHIVDAINSLNWGWLHRALNSIRLAIADSSTISPINKYSDEIIKLSDGDLILHVSKIKDSE